MQNRFFKNCGLIMNPGYSQVVKTLLSRYIQRKTLGLASTPICSVCSGGVRTLAVSSETRNDSRFTYLSSVELVRNRTCLLQSRTMAGHSKWQNIKHVKAAKDKERASVIVQITNKIKSHIRETGSADPKFNPTLARLVAEAKNKNVPSSNIDAAIAQAAKARDAASIVYYEGRGPGGSYFVVEASTDKATKTKNDLQSLVKKQGATFGETGTAKHAFDKKGVIETAVPEGNLDMDKFVDVAIEAGAEEVTMETDETDEQYLRFLCEAQDLYPVKKELEKKQMEVKSFAVEFLPTSMVFPQPKEMELIEKIMEKLEDYPEVIRVFVNVDAPDS